MHLPRLVSNLTAKARVHKREYEGVLWLIKGHKKKPNPASGLERSESGTRQSLSWFDLSNFRSVVIAVGEE